MAFYKIGLPRTLHSLVPNVLIALDRDGQKILTVNMMNPISNGKITGQKVEIIFSSEPHIQTALTRVFEEKLQPGPVNTFNIHTA